MRLCPGSARAFRAQLDSGYAGCAPNLYCIRLARSGGWGDRSNVRLSNSL